MDIWHTLYCNSLALHQLKNFVRFKTICSTAYLLSFCTLTDLFNFTKFWTELSLLILSKKPKPLWMTAVTASTCLYYSHNASEWREVLKQVKALANLPLTCFLHKSSRNFIKKEGKEKRYVRLTQYFRSQIFFSNSTSLTPGSQLHATISEYRHHTGWNFTFSHFIKAYHTVTIMPPITVHSRVRTSEFIHWTSRHQDYLLGSEQK